MHSAICLQSNCRLEMHWNIKWARYIGINVRGNSIGYHLWIDSSRIALTENIYPEAKNYIISVEKLGSVIDVMKNSTRILINLWILGTYMILAVDCHKRQWNGTTSGNHQENRHRFSWSTENKCSRSFVRIFICLHFDLLY